MDCIFCKIVNHDIPATVVYEDDLIIVIEDIEPVAPIHWLIIPKQHVKSVVDITKEEGELITHIHSKLASLAALAGMESDGFRLVSNVGKHGGQTVPHLHYHMIGGRQLQWPSF